LRISPTAALLTSLGIGVAAPVHGASTEAGLGACTALDDDAARLACYDRLAGFVKLGAPAASTAPAAPPMPAPEAAAEAVTDFGLSDAAKRARAPEKWREATPDSVVLVVASVRTDQLGRFTATMEDGQVWVQNETKSSATLRPGEQVTIKRGALESYMLVTPRKVATRVRRVR